MPEIATTAYTDDGEIILFMPPSEVEPDGYVLRGRNLSVYAGKIELYVGELADLAFDAMTKRPGRAILAVGLTDDGVQTSEKMLPALV